MDMRWVRDLPVWVRDVMSVLDLSVVFYLYPSEYAKRTHNSPLPMYFKADGKGGGAILIRAVDAKGKELKYRIGMLVHEIGHHIEAKSRTGRPDLLDNWGMTTGYADHRKVDTDATHVQMFLLEAFMPFCDHPDLSVFDEYVGYVQLDRARARELIHAAGLKISPHPTLIKR